MVVLVSTYFTYFGSIGKLIWYQSVEHFSVVTNPIGLSIDNYINSWCNTLGSNSICMQLKFWMNCQSAAASEHLRV